MNCIKELCEKFMHKIMVEKFYFRSNWRVSCRHIQPSYTSNVACVHFYVINLTKSRKCWHGLILPWRMTVQFSCTQIFLSEAANLCLFLQSRADEFHSNLCQLRDKHRFPEIIDSWSENWRPQFLNIRRAPHTHTDRLDRDLQRFASQQRRLHTPNVNRNFFFSLDRIGAPNISTTLTRHWSRYKHVKFNKSFSSRHAHSRTATHAYAACAWKVICISYGSELANLNRKWPRTRNACARNSKS